jgi:hypothetical protein
MDPLNTFASVWNFHDMIQIVLLSITLLMMLYALYLTNRKIRLIESDLSSIKKDTALISEELETIAPQLRKLTKE